MWMNQKRKGREKRRKRTGGERERASAGGRAPLVRRKNNEGFLKGPFIDFGQLRFFLFHWYPNLSLILILILMELDLGPLIGYS